MIVKNRLELDLTWVKYNYDVHNLGRIGHYQYK